MTIGGRARVDLNFVPSTSMYSDTSPGDGTRLVKNALLFGAPPALTVTPSPLRFSAPSGPVNATLTVKNDSMVTLSVTAATISMNPTEFALVTPPTFPVTLAPAASTTLTVRFTPSTTGTRTGELTLTSDGAVTTHKIPLNGASGPPGIGLASSSIVFGALDVGSLSTPSSLSIGNIGFTPLTVSSITLGGTNPGDFSLTLPTLPATIAASGSTSISAKFAPTAVGMRSATITIASDDPSAPTKSVNLYGEGRAPDAGVDASPDTAVMDSAPADTTISDTATIDSTSTDTTSPDTNLEDATVEDTAVADTSTTPADTSTTDTASADAGPVAVTPASDEGCGCTTAGRSADGGAGLALAALLLATRRRRR